MIQYEHNPQGERPEILPDAFIEALPQAFERDDPLIATGFEAFTSVKDLEGENIELTAENHEIESSGRLGQFVLRLKKTATEHETGIKVAAVTTGVAVTGAALLLAARKLKVRPKS